MKESFILYTSVIYLSDLDYNYLKSISLKNNTQTTSLCFIDFYFYSFS